MSVADSSVSENVASDSAEDYRPASPRELKLLIKDWRTGRATKKLGDAISDGYVKVFGFLLVGAMIVNVVVQAQGAVSQCTGNTCLSARSLLPWATFALSVAAALVVSRLFGPVLASAAEGFWLLDAPVKRSRLLSPRLIGTTIAGFVAGLGIGALVSALTGSPLREVAVWAVGTALATAAAISFAAAEQGVDRHILTRVLSYLFGVIGVAALLGVISVAADWYSVTINTARGTELGLAALIAAAVVLAAAAAVAQLRLGGIRRARLLSGGALVSGISGAFFALDFGLVRDIVIDRRALEIGHVKSRAGRSVGLKTLVWREAQRLARNPQPLLWVLLSLVVPYAVDALGLRTLMPIFGALVLFFAMVPMFNGLRVLTRTAGLARCMPYTTTKLKQAVVAIPAVVVVCWAAAAVPAFVGFGHSHHLEVKDAVLEALITGAAGFFGAIRWTTGKPPNFGGPALSTQFGAMPPGMAIGLIRGFDMCLLITAPLLLQLSPTIALIIAVIVGIVMLTVDTASLKAQSEEQQKQLAEQKKQRAQARK
jgi:hypothetical protein